MIKNILVNCNFYRFYTGLIMIMAMQCTYDLTITTKDL